VHHARYFGEDLADAGCHVRHNRGGGKDEKTGHESIFDQILTSGIARQAPERVNDHGDEFVHALLAYRAAPA
jgi:hypothetical protein